MTGEQTYEDECARRGADLLDGCCPGWRAAVRVESMDVRDGKSCVLGHLFVSFSIGCRLLDLSYAEPQRIIDLGFDVELGDEGRYQRLQEAWERVLRDPAPRFGESARGAPTSVLDLTDEGGDRPLT